MRFVASESPPSFAVGVIFLPALLHGDPLIDPGKQRWAMLYILDFSIP